MTIITNSAHDGQCNQALNFVLFPHGHAECWCERLSLFSVTRGEGKSLGTSEELHEGPTRLIEGRKTCISSVVRSRGRSSEAN